MSLTLVKLIAYLSIIVSLSACAGLPVLGKVGDQTIETRVDSEAARYYLARYLGGERGDPALDERINSLYRGARSELPDRAELKRVSDEFSIDFAALYLADRIARVPMNRRFRARFDRALVFARKTFAQARLGLPGAVEHYEVLFVPGFLYKRHPASGADFARPRRALQSVGLPAGFVETIEDGAIEANADFVTAAVRQRAQGGRRLIVVSASKSGPEMALALTRLGPAETRHVAAWVNIVGTLQGSALADNGLWEQMEELIGKVDIAGIESLTTTRSRERFLGFHIPEHVLVVNYIGIPLSGSLSSWARSGFLELKKDGPNDGLSLLSDLIMPHGVTLAELGRDHFLLNEAIDVRTVALAITVIEWLEADKALSTFRPESIPFFQK
jgi:hypothetical protein